jgi:hypothetical protein
LAALAARQKSTLDESERLNGERSRRANWSRGQLKTLGATARQQKDLESETLKIADRLKNAEVYQWALRHGADDMQIAADRLGKQLTDRETLERQTRAWNGLRNLADALKTPQPNADPKADESPSSEDEQDAAPDGIPPAAQLALLKSLQEDLLRRTSELDLRRRKPSDSAAPTPAKNEAGRVPDESGQAARMSAEQSQSARLGAEQTESARLAAEQGDLALLFERMISKQRSMQSAEPGQPARKVP